MKNNVVKLKNKNLIQDLIQPEKRRGADYKLLKAFEAFEVVTDSNLLEGTCGNIQSSIMGKFNIETGNYDGGLLKSAAPFYDQISAPMLLARLVAAGVKISVEGQDGYKVTWTAILKHKKTGHIVTFYDYKGASSFGSSYAAIDDKATIKDLVKLLEALVNPKFPHPYDGCVVGEIA